MAVLGNPIYKDGSHGPECEFGVRKETGLVHNALARAFDGYWMAPDQGAVDDYSIDSATGARELEKERDWSNISHFVSYEGKRYEKAEVTLKRR